MANTAQQLAALKDRIQTATTRRTEAEAAQRIAQRQVESVNTAIRQLGFDPDTAEQSLVTLEAELDTKINAALVAVDAEIAELDTIIAAAKQAGVL